MQEKTFNEYEQLMACSFVNWHRIFDKIAFESVVVEIPEHIVQYLLEEMIILPAECQQSPDGIEDENDALDEPSPTFPEFSQLLTEKIDQMGGSVYIKTNWHGPRDAFWITAGQTLRCRDITDIYQLLKASCVCKEDLNCHGLTANSVDNTFNTKQYLVLKKWHEIHPGTEFRCYVRNKRLVAISPRDWPQYHEHLCTQKFDIVNDIVSVFKEHIKYRFPLNDYVFDVIRDSKEHVILLDFSPFGDKWTETLAFEWTDLDEKIEADGSEEDPEFRYLSSECGIQPRTRNHYSVPKDILDMFQAMRSTQNEDHCTDDQLIDDLLSNRLETICQERTENDDD